MKHTVEAFDNGVRREMTFKSEEDAEYAAGIVRALTSVRGVYVKCAIHGDKHAHQGDDTPRTMAAGARAIVEFEERL